MNKNPVLQKKFDEGYAKGFAKGAEYGRDRAIDFFADKFEGLESVPGIGSKTLEKIRIQLGEQHFVRSDGK